MPRGLGEYVAHGALAIGVAIVVSAELAQRGVSNGADLVWLTLECVAMGAALVVAWWRQDDLRLVPLLVLTAVFGVATVLVHHAVGIPGDSDGVVYATQGNLLLDGDYPRSEYPVGAVLSFGLDALLGGDSVITSHGLLMTPFHVATVAGVWLLRTPWSPWLAAVVALWPANLFFVHLRFEPIVIALLVAGLVMARREKWALAGALLGVGAAVKWSPALAGVVLVAWLVASHRRRHAVRHATAFLLGFAALNVPFLAWQAGDVLAAYTTQSGRGIIAESLPYLPLHLAGLAEQDGGIWQAAIVPGWADSAAVVVQTALILLIVALAVRAADDLDAAVAIAAMAPAVFLLTNRVFSPQFALVAFAMWAVAASVLAGSARMQLAAGSSAMLATYANAAVFPGLVDPFLPWSALFFGVSVALTGWLLVAAARRTPDQMMIGTVPPSTDQAAPVT